MSQVKLQALAKRLGYEFRNQKFLAQALRHRSLGKDSNERLEFLGDAVLNCLIAIELYQRYPECNEGELSRLRANLVNGEVLAELALAFGLADLIQVGSGEARGGGAQRASILADAMEAVLGALYLDGGFEVLQVCVRAWFAPRLAAVGALPQKDPKTLLQEFTQRQRLPLPQYELVQITGAAHAQTFTIKCSIAGLSGETIGVGPNKRRAEREAARQFFDKVTE